MKIIKNMFFIYITSRILFACSIDKNTTHDAIRRIVNETELNVRVEVFSDEQKFSYRIAVKDSIDILGYCEGPRYRYCKLGWSDLSNGRIYFGNEKVQIFEGSASDDYNEKFINITPVRSGFGYEKTNENGIEVYTYRITPEDYENAKDCDGHCD